MTATSTLTRLPLAQLQALRMITERDAVGLTTIAVSTDPEPGEVTLTAARALARRGFVHARGSAYSPTGAGVAHLKDVAQGNALPAWAGNA